MQITWVNHASFVVSTDTVNLICDPWIEGRSFDNGWSLVSKTKFTYNDFANITHIFFSHEHPDHFSPPNLRSIPEAYRREVTVVFHETLDKRVVNLCKGLKFKIVELPKDTWIPLSEKVAILCGRQGMIDSWLAIHADGRMLLNLNDCAFEDDVALHKVRRLVGIPDVLFTQFSYANWVGNPDDHASHRAAARKKLDDIARQIRILRPKTTVPCASFVWFSHEENFFANREANRIGDAYEFLAQELKVSTTVLYPGDTWDVGHEVDSRAALEQYGKDYAAIETAPLSKSRRVSLAELRTAHSSFLRKALARNNRYLLQTIPSSVVQISDLGLKVRISLLRGLQIIEQSAIADIVVSSEALQYCYLYDWGGDTLAINGRYTVPPNGNARKFFWNFRVATYNSIGQGLTMPVAVEIGKRYLSRKLRLPIWRKTS